MLREWVLFALVASCVGTPNVSVSGLAFSDLDLDEGELGGTIGWVPPANATEVVVAFEVGLASDSSGSNLRALGSVALGTNELVLAAGTSVGGSTHLVVYTSNEHGRQAVPAAAVLDDIAASVVGVELVDLDLDGGELGGTVTWSCTATPPALAQYVVYLATSKQGAGRLQVGEAVVVGTNFANLPADTSVNLFSFVLVYTASSMAEQTTPAAAVINDTASSVANLTFVDVDLDAAQLGGAITWVEPPDALHVTHYSVYWAEDAAGSVRALIQTVAVGTNVVDVPPETALLSQTHILVYALSALGEQTTPVAHQFLDHAASVTNLAFIDMDLDGGELGGNVTWLTPVNPFQVSAYRVYFALSFSGLGRSQFGTDLAAGVARPYIPADTPREEFTHLLVYTVSLLVEQTTPVGIVLQDSYGGVSDVAFLDLDLDASELGGTATWAAPGGVSQVLGYNVYVAHDHIGASRSLLEAVAVHTNAVAVPADFAMASFTHLLVYSVSGLGEQSTPSSVALTDTHGSVASVAFTDLDLDADELGGTVSWSPPASAWSAVESYNVFLATTLTGESRARLGSSVSVGTNALLVPADTQRGAHPFIVVFAASPLGEQSVPVALAIEDTAQSASSVAFTDLDLDPLEIGGSVTWSSPVPAQLVTHYAVYLASNADGSGKAFVGTVPSGTEALDIPADVAMGSYTHVVVFAQSSLAEQTTPAAALLSDQTALVADVSFQDLDGDASELGGTLTWVPSGNSLVTQHVVYLASGASAADSRSQLGVVPAGTNFLSIYINTPLGSYSHLVVHERSSFSEQSVPAGAIAVVDLDASVVDLTFGDIDFDLGEIGGVISWMPPVGVGAVTHFSVYLAQDAAGTVVWQVGSDVAVGTNMVRLPVSTAVSSWAHVLVFSRTSLALQTTPAAVDIADAPLVTIPTRWTIANAARNEPGGNRRWALQDAGVQWKVQEVVFFRDESCLEMLHGVRISSGQWGQYHGPDMAFDSNPDTAWHSQCAPCDDLEAWVGIAVDDVVRCVRWLQSPVATGEGSGAVAFQIGGQEFARASGLRGGRWEGLRYSAPGGGWQRA